MLSERVVLLLMAAFWFGLASVPAWMQGLDFIFTWHGILKIPLGQVVALFYSSLGFIALRGICRITD